MTVAEILRLFRVTRLQILRLVVDQLGGSIDALEDVDEAMESDSDVSDANGFDDFKYNNALDQVTGTVATMRILGFDMELSQIAGSLSQR